MGPKIKEAEVKYNIEDSFITAALPFNEAKYKRIDNCEENDNTTEIRNDIPSTSDDLEEANPLRISTRARLTYELDSRKADGSGSPDELYTKFYYLQTYSKNAMLIFEGSASDIAYDNQLEEDTLHNEHMITKIKQMFEKFRFEVEIHRNLKDDEIARTCDQFFQQDFTEYGCVAIMLLAKTKEGIVESSHTPNSEYGVLRYLSDLSPPSLQDKPKIYIVQTESYYVIPRARVWSQLPQDTLEFRLPVPVVSAPDAKGKRSKVCCLLEHVYEKINSMADQSDLQTILQDAANEFTRHWQLDLPIGCYSSLTKELRLAGAPEPSLLKTFLTKLGPNLQSTSGQMSPPTLM